LTALDIDPSSDSEQIEETDHPPASSSDIRADQQYLGEKIDQLKISAWSALIGFVALALLTWLFRY
jgi:hypothetical protein